MDADLFFTALHEAGHGWMALRDDPNQTVRLDILTKGGTHEGWCESEWSTPRQLMAGMAAELVFGNSWASSMTGAAGDRANFREHFRDQDWRAALREARHLIDRRQAEVAVIALLLFQYRTLSQDECLECMMDPTGTLRAHAVQLEAGRLMRSIEQAIPEPWYRDLTLDVELQPPRAHDAARSAAQVSWLWLGSR
jgi:hypothetical protein